MPRHGGAGGRWVKGNSSKSRHRKNGKGQQRAATIPPSSAQFPQINIDFATGRQPGEKVDPGVVLKRINRNRTERRNTLQK